MAIRYTYEKDGQLAPMWFAFNLPADVVEAGQLHPDQVKQLLEANKVDMDEISLVCYFDEEKDVYAEFSTPMALTATSTLKITLRKSRNEVARELSEELTELKKRMELLETPQFITTPSSFVRSGIDVAVLLAAPLVRVTGRERRGLYHSNLDFESDKRELLKYLRAASIPITVKFEAATLQNLSQVLQLKPSILQIECHGCLKNDIGRFFLAFEDSRNMGELKEVNSEMLHETLREATQGDLSNLIVLVNACYSQTVANVFLKVGIRCVIAVHQQTRVLDVAVKMFTQEFYRQLFSCHQTVRDAYNLAMQSVRREQSVLLTCCCAHDHTPTCTWSRKATHNKESIELCREHTATCSCPTAKVNNFHNPKCTWARDFLFDYASERQLTEQEAKDGYVVCCCKPEVPHGECMKFILFADSEFENHRIDSIDGEEARIPTLDKPTPPLITTRTIGQHDKIQEIVSALGKHSNSRCINVIGSTKVGKTVLVKRAVYYAFERQAFTDGVIYVDMTGRTSFSYIYREIEHAMKTSGLKTKQDLCNFISGLSLLLIIDGTEDVLRHEHSDFVMKLSFIVENTVLSKILIVSNEPVNIEGTTVIKVNPLSNHRAAELLVSLTGDILPPRLRKDYVGLGKHRLFSLIGTSPNDIKLVASSITKPEDLERIVKSHEQGIKEQNQETVAHQLATDYLAANPHRESLFRLLCFFPSGLHKNDLAVLCERLGILHKETLPGLTRQGSEDCKSWYVEESGDWLTAHPGLAQYVTKNELFRAKSEYVSEVVCYLAELSRSLVRTMAKVSPYIDLSNLKLFSAVVDHGLWGAPSEVEVNIPIPDNLPPKKYYERHERNFLHFLNPDRLGEAADGEPNHRLMTIIGELALCTSTCCLLLWSKDQALETLHLGLRICERFHIQKYFCSLLLMEASLIDSTDQSESLRLTAYQGFNEMDCADGLVEAYLFQLLHRERINARENKEISELLKNQLSRTRNCDLARARMDLAIAESKILSEDAKHHVLSKISSAFDVFVRLKREHWAVRCLIAKIDFYLLEGTTKDLMRIYHDAVSRAQPLKNPILSKLLSEKQVLINSKLPRRNLNFLAFLKAMPLVRGFERAGPVARVFNTFRSDVKEMLKSTKKQVYVRFDPASLESLVEVVQNGCCILHLSSIEYVDNSFVFENPDGSAHIVPLSETISRLKSVTSPSLKLVVLEIPFARALAEALHTQLGVPHVIYFPMKDFSNSSEFFPIREVVDKAVSSFSVKFYERLLSGTAVKDAFSEAQTALNSCLESLKKKVEDAFVNDRARAEWTKVMKGATLIDEISDVHIRRLFSEDSKPGNMQDLSKPRSPSNIQKEVGARIGRHIELYKAIKSLEEGMCVHITGPPGIGKTTFLKDLGYQFLARSRYLDGIYYLSLKGKGTLDLTSLELVQSADQLNSLQGKKMLLLLDDCDTMTRRQHEQQFRFLLQFLCKKCQVGVIFASRMSFLSTDSRDYISQITLQTATPEESAVLSYIINPELRHIDVDMFSEKESLIESLSISPVFEEPSLSLKKIVSLAISSHDSFEIFKLPVSEQEENGVAPQLSSHMSVMGNGEAHRLAASDIGMKRSSLQRQMSTSPVSPPMQFGRPLSGKFHAVLLPTHERQDSEDQVS